MTPREHQTDTDNELLRTLGRRALSEPTRRNREKLLQEAYYYVLRGVGSVNRARRQETAATEEELIGSDDKEKRLSRMINDSSDEVLRVAGLFLEQQFVTEKYLRGFIEADSCIGHIVTYAQTFARQQHSASPSWERQLRANETKRATDLDEKDEDAAEDKRSDRDIADQRRAFQSLSEEERILLRIQFMERAPLEEHIIRFLARQRQVVPSVVRAECDARCVRQEQRRLSDQEQLEAKNDRVRELHLRIHEATEMQRLFDGRADLPGGAPPPERLSSERCKQMSRPSGFKKASAPERSGYIAHLRTLYEQEYRLRDEAMAAMERQLPTGPGHEEIAVIWGAVTADAPEAQRKTAADSIRKKLTRAALKVRELALKGGSDE